MRLAGLERPSKHLPAPDPETTMRVMAKLIVDGQYDGALRNLAEQIVRGLTPHDYLSEYAAVLNWVRQNIRYVRDPRTIEQVKTPRVIVETGSADCDDMAILIGTLVGALGGQVRLVAAAFAGKEHLTHVWCEAFDPLSKAWVVLDPVPGRRVDEMLKRISKRLVVSVLN